MKVICITSCAGPEINLVAGKEYDLTKEQIKAVGSSARVIEKPAKAKKNASNSSNVKRAPASKKAGS